MNIYFYGFSKLKRQRQNWRNRNCEKYILKFLLCVGMVVEFRSSNVDVDTESLMGGYWKLFLGVVSLRLVHSGLWQYTPLLFTTERACPRILGERMLRAKLDFWLNEESATCGWSRENWATASLWGCCWSAIHMSQIFRSHWDSEESSLWPGGGFLQLLNHTNPLRGHTINM